MSNSWKYALWFLGIGAFCPIISWTTAFLMLYESIANKHHASPVFIPFMGPILLNAGLVCVKAPLWSFPFVWVLDLGTVAFLMATPGLMRDWWRTSSFTLMSTLDGKKDGQTVVISLHTTGAYVLNKTLWMTIDKIGVGSVCDFGHFLMEQNDIRLHSHRGDSLILKQQGDDEFAVEQEGDANANFSLNGWVLKRV